MDKIKIIISEDHCLVREGLKTLLNNERDVEVVDVCANGKDAIILAERLNPDIIIMDISMPVLNGIDAAKIIYEKGIKSKVILLTMHEEEKFIDYINENFISGYVLKENSFNDLIYAIRSVFKGGKYISPYLTKKILNQNKNKIIDSLTTREKEVLKLIIEGNSVKKIAEKLFISEKTVETHKSKIMKKFNVSKSIELVKKALNENFFNNI